MSDGATSAWPNPLAEDYELRLTARARDDLGVPGTCGSDLDDIASQCSYPDIVEKFRKMRTLDPEGSEKPAHKV